ncbi:PAS domain-containing protein [Stappia sp. F7233]|uniref:PAS domain-containing protein n=1 Tax=Stappia albiluteola TaxID=2758565 RepID=A0A839AFU6_9HYPH|nr:PAS domain-containing protein [Stappia albiluteola]MBA5777898.1 PAS domain-containing protein [Stappia albiluteola]
MMDSFEGSDDARASSQALEMDETDAGMQKPALSLAGLTFFVVDAVAKQILWMEPEGLDFEGSAGLHQAPLTSALRLLSQGDQKQILSLIQHAVQKGAGGPIELGGDELGQGLSLTAQRYDVAGGGALVIAAADAQPPVEATGAAVRGVAPLIRHLVESSPRAVLVVDSFGYVRYANDNFFTMFQIDDPKFCIGRNIAHIPARLGKTLPGVILTGLARRAPAQATRRFFLANGDAMSLNFSLMPFRVSAGLGGAVFMAERKTGGDLDFFRVFDAVATNILVVDVKTRMIVAANQAARKSLAMTQQMMESAPVTENLLHPKTLKALIDQAQSGNPAPMQASVSGFDGVTRSKRLRPVLLQQEENFYLVIESKH